MKEILAVISLLLFLILFTVVAPSIVVLRWKNEYLMNECIKRGYAEMLPSKDDPKALELKFKDNHHETGK